MSRMDKLVPGTAVGRMRSVYRRLPGAQWLKQNILFPSGHGSWLYTADTVAWMYRPELNRQLPRSFRLFAEFCRHQAKLWDPVLGGQRLLELGIWWNHLISEADSLRLEIDNRVVFLDLLDPRMLQVPNELLDSSIANTIEQCLAPGDTFLDIGANHGTFSIVAGHKVGQSGMVLAFEPQPRLANLVRRSLSEISGLCFDVFQIACGDREGEVEFFVPRESSGRAGIFAEYSASRSHRMLPVKMKPLDELVAGRELRGNIFIKVDVEGAEAAVLSGARLLVERYRPRMLIEINPRAMQAAGTSLVSFKSWFLERDYTLYSDVNALGVRHRLRDFDTKRHQNIILWPPGESP